MTTLLTDPALPEEIREAVEPDLQELLHLIPTWCNSLHLAYDPDEDAHASMSASEETRDAKLKIGAHYLTQSPRQRTLTLLHEIAHIHMAPMEDLVESLKKLADLEGAPAKFLETQCEATIERVAEDLANGFIAALDFESDES